MPSLFSIWKRFTSLKITITCLFILFILTAWGTYYQSEYGLYAAQSKFFYSFFFLIGGFFPFPGAQLVLWILSVNLLSDALLHFKRRVNRPGIFLIHWGIITLLLGSFITYYFAQESYLALYEGETANVSTDYRDWEIAVWKKNNTGTNNVFAYRVESLYTGEKLFFQVPNLNFKVLSYFQNARANKVKVNEVKSSSGITSLRGVKNSYDPAENLPGVVLEYQENEEAKEKILLWAGEKYPAEIQSQTKLDSISETSTFYLQLRRVRHPLPISIELDNFTKENYLGTEIVKNYESLIKVKEQGLERKVRIYMNHPFRYGDFTFYQASYQIDPDGREKTVLAVVKNAGRLLPYVSSGIVFAGLTIHFLLMLVRFILRQKHLGVKFKEN